MTNKELKNQNISFFIPAWNCEKTINESIDSIIRTNLKNNDEIVIVDDASTDSTPKIIENYAKKYNFIKIIHLTKNEGGSIARNIAIKNCKNEILFCLDSDNILVSNSIDKLKNFMLKEKADAVAFEALHYFKQNTKNITFKWVFKKKLHTLSDCLAGSISPIASGNYMFTKNSWKKAGKYTNSVRTLDTWVFGFKQLATKTKMMVMPNSFYYHRHGIESNWVSHTKKGVNRSLIAYETIKPFFNLIDKKDVQYIKKHKNNWFPLNAHPIKTNEGYGKTGEITNKKTIRDIIKKIPFTKKIYENIKKITNKRNSTRNFKKEFRLLKKLSKNDNRFNIKWENKYTKLDDKTSDTKFDAHYIYHPAWASRIIAKTKPKKHIDISSVLHFCSIISAFVPTEFYDFRPPKLNLKNLIIKKGDVTSLPFEDNSIKSLSCMHTIEHIGLGRYGDKIDPIGDLKAIKELERILAPNGNLLFVVPIGKPKIIFNAHRIYSYDQIIKCFEKLKLQDFSLVTDSGNFIENSNKKMANNQKYGCGCFWFRKI